MVNSLNHKESLPLDWHDEILDNLVKPSWLVEGELRDHKWLIRSVDRQDPDDHLLIDFDQGISPWPDVRSLLDPIFVSDLITLKLVVYLSLQPTPLGWVKSSSSARIQFTKHLAFIRWRLDRGIESNALLTAAWFNEFHASMKKGDRIGLLRLTERIQRVLAAFDREELHLQRDKRGQIDTSGFARMIGVTHGSEIPANLRNQVQSFFADRNLRYNRLEVNQEQIAAKRYITQGHANTFYKVWFDLDRLKDHLPHDPIGYQAFKSRRDISKYTSGWTNEVQRTDDAPAYQTSYLINASLNIILSDLADDAIELIRGGLDQKGEVKNVALLDRLNRQLTQYGFERVSPLYVNSSWRRSEELTVSEFVFVVIPAAVRVVIAAFTARRDEEVATLQTDCIESEDVGHAWLHCRIAKNMRRTDRIPVPHSVIRAVTVLKKIRALGGTQGTQLFSYTCPVRTRSFKFTLAERLDLVRDFFNVPLMDDGTPWHFTPHQFRKFFGVTYHWRWAFPDLTALSYHYRHFNPDTTRAYIEMKAAEALRMQDDKLAERAREKDLERKKDLDEGRVAFVKWVIAEVLAGQELGGSFGRRLMQQVEELKQEFLPQLDVTQDAEASGFGDILQTLTATNEIRIHPEGHSICGCRGLVEDTSVSTCLRLKQLLIGTSPSAADGPDFAYADDEACLVCPNRGTLPAMAPYWDNAIRQVTEVLTNASGELARKSIQRLRIIEKYA